MAPLRSHHPEGAPAGAAHTGAVPPDLPADIAGLPFEITGLSTRLTAAALHEAAARADRLGIGADEVLLACGTTTPDIVARLAAERLGIAFDELEEEPADTPPDAPLSPGQMRAMLRSGLMRRPDGVLVIAARGLRLRRLERELAVKPALRGVIRLTTPERLALHLRRHHPDTLAHIAAGELRQTWPRRSAGTLGLSRYLLAAATLAGVGIGLSTLALPGLLLTLVPLVAVLLGWSGLRLTASALAPQAPMQPPRDDRALPAYSLIVPLYHEAAVVPQLIDALAALDYPPEKLQVMLVIERDDHDTVTALVRHAMRPGFDIIFAPEVGPKTKPKALNAALPFTRGDIIGIFDAEDVPDPQQLRRACAAFAAPGARRLGCVQARLAIDNVADSWITRQFAAEYAAHFDVVLPLIAGCRLPLPLGGTSNHFRRTALEGVGAWDPYNVAEDADLGLRLARQGWRTGMIASTTDEEAPRHFGAWLRQRTRWCKGWMQTLLVHGREPRQLYAQIGGTGLLSFMCLIGGGLISALMHPVFALMLALDIALGRTGSGSLASALLDGMGIAVLVVGYGATALCTMVGMRHRRLPGMWRVLPLIPLYWLMLSAAAWRALFQLIAAPARWEKTEHGLARTSRRRPVRLRLRNTDAARPRPRRAGA